MKKTLLALALVASTYGAFAAQPALSKKQATQAATEKPKKHKHADKAAVKETGVKKEEAKPEVKKSAVVAPKAAAKAKPAKL